LRRSSQLEVGVQNRKYVSTAAETKGPKNNYSWGFYQFLCDFVLLWQLQLQPFSERLAAASASASAFSERFAAASTSAFSERFAAASTSAFSESLAAATASASASAF
jgi:hypothetical protein